VPQKGGNDFLINDSKYNMTGPNIFVEMKKQLTKNIAGASC